jgi:hypothetical protein
VKKLSNEKRKMHRGFWWGTLNERHLFKELGVDGRIK